MSRSAVISLASPGCADSESLRPQRDDSCGPSHGAHPHPLVEFLKKSIAYDKENVRELAAKDIKRLLTMFVGDDVEFCYLFVIRCIGKHW